MTLLPSIRLPEVSAQVSPVQAQIASAPTCVRQNSLVPSSLFGTRVDH